MPVSIGLDSVGWIHSTVLNELCSANERLYNDSLTVGSDSAAQTIRLTLTGFSFDTHQAGSQSNKMLYNCLIIRGENSSSCSELKKTKVE